MAYHGEKVPEEYSQRKLQNIIDRIFQKIGKATGDQSKALQDTSQQLKSQISSTEERLTVKIESKGDRPVVPFTLPIPQGLKVVAIGVFGIAMVNPFIRWFFPGKIWGFEFFGSCNTGFSARAREDDYNFTGFHTGSNGDNYLDSNLVLEGVLVGKEILNLTQKTSGTIVWRGGLRPNYRVYSMAEGGGWLYWDTNDQFMIKNYTRNKLFSIGPFAFFLKPPLLHFYVKARTEGVGGNYSQFTDEVSTAGADEDIPKPEIDPDESKEIAHYNLMGVEWCDVEIVVNVDVSEDLSHNITLEFLKGTTTSSEED